MTNQTAVTTPLEIEILDSRPDWMISAQNKVHDLKLKAAASAVKLIDDSPEDMSRLAATYPEHLVFAPVHKAVLELLEKIMAELEELREKFRKKSLKLRQANRRIKNLKEENQALKAKLESEQALKAYLLEQLGMTPEELRLELLEIETEAKAEEVEADKTLAEKAARLEEIRHLLQSA